MMVYSIYDRASKSFLSLSLFSNDSVAIRAFSDVVNYTDGLRFHPDDYALYSLTEFFPDRSEDDTPLSFNLMPPVLVAEAKDLLKEVEHE